MFGFLLQWSTLLTLAMFPIMVIMCLRLAISEERDAEREFGEAWRTRAAAAPHFVQPWGGARTKHA
jgi:protein-S-isoprenylcysteine O-methyltransferase Ste14